MARITTVLLDRDGTVIVDKHYLADPAGVELLPGAAEGLITLRRAGMRLFVVTNQSGIGRGYFTEHDYHACQAALARHLHEVNVSLEDSAFCPHAPEEICMCRKPRTGMWQTLAARHSLDARHTAMIGDKRDDILFGRTAGFPAVILVLTGKGMAAAEAMDLPLPKPGEACRTVEAAATPDGIALPHAVARDLIGAALWLRDYPVA